MVILRYGVENLNSNLYVSSLNSNIKIKAITSNPTRTNVFSQKLLKKISDSWFDKVIETDDYREMLLIRQAKFMRALGAGNFKADVPYIPATGKSTSLDISEYAVVFPGASSIVKKWESEKYAQIIRYLYEKYNLQCVVLGSQSEKHIAEKIRKGIDGVPMIDLAGKTTIGELVEIIRGAKIYIGNDTGPTHISAATRTKTICIYHTSNVGQWFPYEIETDNTENLPVVVCHKLECYDCVLTNRKKYYKRCSRLRAPLPCISAITAEEVFVAIDQAMSKTKLRGESI